VSLYSVVSRGMTGRLGQRQVDDATTSVTERRSRTPGVRLPGASMHVLEVALAIGAIATAILIGIGR
jgi:hypothetical protein